MFFADSVLVAVFYYLKETVEGSFRIAGILRPGSARVSAPFRPTFNSQDEAEEWLSQRLQFPEPAATENLRPQRKPFAPNPRP